MDSRDLIIGEIQNAVSRLLGDSAAAVMRKAGSSASHKLWPDLPSGKTMEEAGALMSQAVKDLEGWGEFAVVGVDGDAVKIQFKNCYFAGLTEESGKPCGTQPICYFGFGLVEETIKRLTGIATKVELDRRDEGTGVCHETATARPVSSR